MTNSQLTQCPHCKASFKVSEEQLSVANGRVRCGACLNIFDAIAYRISSPPVEHNEENLARELEIDDDFSFLEDAIDLERELLTDEPPTDDLKTEDLEDQTLFADDPEQDKLEKGYSGASKFGDELSTSFMELESSSAAPFSAESQNEEVIRSTDSDSSDENIDESWAASILDDLEQPDNSKTNADLEDTQADQVASTHTSLQDQSGAFSAPYDSNKRSSQEQTEADPFSIKKSELNALNFEYEQDQSPKHRWLAWSFLALINLSLLILLIAQASWYHYEKLVKYPKVAALYEFACQQLGCTLPELSDLSKIENRNLVVKSHPTVFRALIIETIITNQAGFDQPFPSISLSFSDINNNVIAQRLFSPAEYLNKEVYNWSAMPAKKPIQITLEIIDPGPEAVNYAVEFYPNSSPSDLQKNDQMSTNKSKK